MIDSQTDEGTTELRVAEKSADLGYLFRPFQIVKVDGKMTYRQWSDLDVRKQERLAGGMTTAIAAEIHGW